MANIERRKELKRLGVNAPSLGPVVRAPELIRTATFSGAKRAQKVPKM